MSKKLMRKKLALMLANLKKKRPFYTELEYLESTGTQYIDTGILPSEDLRTKVVQAYTGTSIAKNSSILGSNGNGNLRYWINYDNHFEVGYGSYFSTNTVVQPGDINIIDFNYIKNGYHHFSFNGTEYAVTGTPNTEYSIILFGRVVMTQTPILSPQRIYKVQFIRNDVLIGDFIPVLDWDMTPCMYDRVTEQLFYNQGTDDFSYGREIHYVDYLESTGTQYIDTGYPIVTSTDEIVVEYENSSTINNKWLFGEYEENANFGITSYQQSASTVAYAYRGIIVVSKSEQYDAKHTLVANSDGLYNDGVNKSVFKSYESTWNIYLFALNYTGTSINGYFGYGKIYNYKHKRNGVLIRDFIPAIDENGVGAMFDRVSHTIYDNAGTGAFKYPAREVEYIETDGTSYINTGYTPSGSTETEITTMLKNQTYSRFMFGCRTNNASNIYACLAHSSNRIGYRVGDGNYLYSSGYNELNVKHTYKIANGVFYRDGVVVDTTCQGATTSPNSPLALLTINTNNVLDTAQTFVGNFYSCTIKENDTLVRDFIPCYKDGVLGLFDKVNNVFYDNDGTDTFTGGKIVEPEYE